MNNMQDPHYVVNVEAAISHNNTWLMIIRSDKEPHAPDTLSFPGGKVESLTNIDNVLEKALIREITEEVGISIEEKMIYVESKIFLAMDGRYCIDIVFLCKYKAGEPNPQEEEVSAVSWMTYEEIINNTKTPTWIKQSLEKAKVLKESVIL
jgi:ADP-ribose pyrophosphatase YjhB (NUDIX family)